MTGTGQLLYDRAKKIIPGGTQLLSKRPEMFLPQQWPAYYSKAKGAEVWDLDGNRYIDMSFSAVGASILGAADPDVDEAVINAIQSGTVSTLNCPEEVELAQLLCEIHPWATRVRYARSGGEAMTVAVRLARACSGRDHIAFCGYHGWHDWYLSANLGESNALDGHLLPGLSPCGVPRGLVGTAHAFEYNRLDQLKNIISEHGQQLAAIVMEPCRGQKPGAGFLEEVRRLASDVGAVLVFDEITAGWRLNSGGMHLLFDVEPDIAVFGKAIGNGYPMAAIIGRDSVMEAAQESFISSTNWTERVGPVAALATISKHRRENVADHLMAIGRQMQQGWQDAATEAGLKIEVGGLPPLAHFSIDCYDSRAATTLFTQEMLSRGFLAADGFYTNFAHQDQHVSEYMTAAREVFAMIAQAIEQRSIEQMLHGPVAHSGFKRLT